MTTQTKKGRFQATSGTDDSVAIACLVTGSSKLVAGITQYLPGDQLTVRQRLVDLLKDVQCRIVIIDTKVDDIDIWPAPLLVQPRASERSWLFLISNLRDVASLQTLPPDCTFLERSMEHLDSIAKFVTKRLDPESATRIHEVSYVADDRIFIVRLENGRTYALELDDLTEADTSDVVTHGVSRNRHYFRVVQASGTVLEVPWDDVLYHCEPEYRYYEGRKDRDEDARAIRIGHAVRDVRIQRSLSVTELARRAGMQRPNLSRLETGKHLPNLETLERIASALGVPVAELIAIHRASQPHE